MCLLILLLLLSTQISQAAGVAYSLKLDKRGTCAVVYTGDGGTSEVNIGNERFEIKLTFSLEMNVY